MTKYVRKPPQMRYKLVINLESRFITDILPSDATRPRGQYISYKRPTRFITLTYPPVTRIVKEELNMFTTPD